MAFKSPIPDSCKNMIMGSCVTQNLEVLPPRQFFMVFIHNNKMGKIQIDEKKKISSLKFLTIGLKKLKVFSFCHKVNILMELDDLRK